jgi:anti-anti-sigma regulatory factor
MYKFERKSKKMGIKNISNDVLLVELPSKSPKIANQLKALNEAVSKKGDCDVIIDFSRVEIINSANISNLLILHNMQEGSGRQLILCNVATVTKCIFVVAGLNTIFNFADNKSKAMATVEQGG